MNIVLKVKRALKLADLKIHTEKIQPNLQSKTVNPSINEQNITPDTNYNGLSNVVVNGVNSSIDSNIQSGNIKDGVSILGVQGNFAGSTDKYFYDSLDYVQYSTFWYSVVKYTPKFNMVAGGDMSSFWSNCSLESLDLSGVDFTATTNINNLFNASLNLKEVDFTGTNFPNLVYAGYVFRNCKKMEKINMGDFDFTALLYYNFSNFFGINQNQGVPNNCLIIVKDQANKEMLNTQFPRLTNIKTREEYENE